jgi:hypothetical protein
MAAKTQGLVFLYGVGSTSPANSQIISLSLSKSDSNVSMVEDGTGNVTSIRTDAQVDEISIELRVIAAFTELNIGDKFTLAGVTLPVTAGDYMIKTVASAFSNKDFVQYNITAAKYEGLTLT